MAERLISRREVLGILVGGAAVTLGLPMFLSKEAGGFKEETPSIPGSVLFARPKDKNKHNLYIQDFNSGSRELGAHTGSWGVISPDSQLVALRSGGYTKPIIEIVSLNNGAVEEIITDISGQDKPWGLPAWSPDNKKFVVQTRNEHGQPGNDSLFIREGSQSFDYLTSGYEPRFCPSDSNIVAMGRTDANLVPNVLLRNLDTGSEELIGEGGAHAWSADGQFLAWNSTNITGNPRPRLHVKNMDSGAIETIDGGRGAAWSPVDNNLAFVHEDPMHGNRLAIASVSDTLGPIIHNGSTGQLGSNFFWLGGEWLAVNDWNPATNNNHSRLVHLSMRQEAELTHPEDVVVGWMPRSLGK